MGSSFSSPASSAIIRTQGPPPTQSISGDKNVLLPKERAKAAILGAFIADAASMPLHRIYDQKLVENLVRYRVHAPSSSSSSSGGGSGSKEAGSPAGDSRDDGGAEFFSPCSCPQYTFPLGQCTPYGKEALPILYSISSCGFFDKEKASDMLYQVMRGTSSMESGKTGFASLHIDYMEQARALGPVSKHFLNTREGGALQWEQCASSTDTQCLGLVKVPLIVARYAGNPKLLTMVEECTKIHQTSEAVLVVCRLAARLLEKVILGMTIRESLAWAFGDDKLPKEERLYLQSLSSVGIELSEGSNGSSEFSSSPPSLIPFSLAAEGFGLDAQLPGCFMSALVALYSFRSYKTAIRANIQAGGDNALRSWFIGAMFAAESADRIDSIPLRWKQSCVDYADIVALTNRVAGSNPHFDSFAEVNFCRI